MKKLALLFGAVLFSLILAEGLLRLTGLGVVRPQIQFGEFTGGQVDDGVFVTDPDLFWREPAGPPDNMHLGSHVVRVGDTPPAKTSRLRVLCIGDSCTRLSSTNSPYPAVLQQILESRAEVFNASLPGYTSHQGLAWLRKQLLDFEPDLVVLYFGWNDHWRSWGVPDSDYARQLSPSSLRVVSLLRGLPDEPPLRLTTDEYRDNLIAMADLVSEAGGKSIILLAPHHITDVAVPHFLANGNILRGDDPQALHHTYLEVARSVGTHPGVRLYDAAAQFTAMGEEKMMLMTDGIHPLDPGHVVLARTLADDIMRHEFRAQFRPLDPASFGFSILAQDMCARGEWTKAGRFYRNAVAGEPEDMDIRLGLAWLLATCPQESVRDGAEALEILAPWVEQGGSSPRFLDVRAAALAEADRFDEAVAEIDRALVLLNLLSSGPPGGISQDLRDRRELYVTGKAFRTPGRGGK